MRVKWILYSIRSILNGLRCHQTTWGHQRRRASRFRSDMEETEGEIAKIDERIEELMTRQGSRTFRSEKTPGGVV